MKSVSARTKVILFLAITFFTSGIQQFFIVTSKDGVGNSAPVLILMWTPGIVAIALALFFKDGRASLGFHFGKIKYYLLAYCVPALAAASVLGLLVLFGFGTFEINPGFLAKKGSIEKALITLLLWAPSIGALIAFGSGLGEEIGWRGYLQNKMIEARIRHPFILIGLIWATWHWPLIIFSNYASSDNRVLSVFLFSIMVASSGVLISWLSYKSKSVFPAGLAHGAHNLWIQGIYPALITTDSRAQHFGGESGIFLAVIYFFLAIIVYRTLPRDAKP